MPRVVHFEIAVDDPDRAAKFYSGVFGWEFTNSCAISDEPQDYWLARTGAPDQPGIDGALMHRQADEHIVNTIDVPSVDEFSARVTANGGQIVVPKMAVPGIGYMAYFRDTEGNMFGMMEMDAAAQ